MTWLRRDGMLRRYHMVRKTYRWHSDHEVVGEVTIVVDIECFEPAPCLRITGWAFGKRIDQRLAVVAQPQPFGGERFYLLCPITGRRCTTLFLPPGKSSFASARGWRVPYASTREREVDRALRTIRKIEAQFGKRSKYTRNHTHARIIERWLYAHDVVDAEIVRRLGYSPP